MKLFLYHIFLLFPLLSSATLLSPYTTNGGVQIMGGNYHSEEDIFESGVRCLMVDESSQIENVRDESASVSALTVLDFKALKNEFGIGMSVGSDGWATSGNDFKACFDFLKSAEETDTSIVFIYKTELKAGDEILKNPFKLTQEAKNALDQGVDEFKNYCGDQFVYKISKGARAFVAVKIDLGTKSNKRKVEAEFKLGFVDLLSLSATLKKLKESMGISATVTIAGFQEGGFAARINGIFGRGEGVANCNTTDAQNCEVTIKDVLNYFSKDFSHQFDHFYMPRRGWEAAPLPNTAKIISYDTRSYCKLAPGDKENLNCIAVDSSVDIDKLTVKWTALTSKLNQINSIINNTNLVLHPDYKEKLLMYRDSIRKDLDSIQATKLACKTDAWVCKSTVAKTLARMQEIEGNLTENVILENRLEFCFTTGLNSNTGKIEWVIKNGDKKMGSFSTEGNPRMGARSCYAFEFHDDVSEITDMEMRVQHQASLDPKCEKKNKNKFLSVMNWELSKVDITNMATGFSKSFEGSYFFKKPKCSNQEEARPFSKWIELKPI